MLKLNFLLILLFGDVYEQCENHKINRCANY